MWSVARCWRPPPGHFQPMFSVFKGMAQQHTNQPAKYRKTSYTKREPARSVKTDVCTYLPNALAPPKARGTCLPLHHCGILWRSLQTSFTWQAVTEIKSKKRGAVGLVECSISEHS